MIKIKPAYWSCGFPMEVISLCIFHFLFYYQNPFGGSWSLVHIILVPLPFFNTILTSDGRNWSWFGLFFISLKKLVGKYPFLQKLSIHNLIYWSPNGCFLFLAIFSTSTFVVSWYFRVFCSFSIERIMLSSSSSILLASAVKYELLCATSDSC